MLTSLFSPSLSLTEPDLDLPVRDGDEVGGLPHLSLPRVLHPELLHQLHHQGVELQTGKPLSDARPQHNRSLRLTLTVSVSPCSMTKGDVSK